MAIEQLAQQIEIAIKQGSIPFQVQHVLHSTDEEFGDMYLVNEDCGDKLAWFTIDENKTALEMAEQIIANWNPDLDMYSYYDTLSSSDDEEREYKARYDAISAGLPFFKSEYVYHSELIELISSVIDQYGCNIISIRELMKEVRIESNDPGFLEFNNPASRGYLDMLHAYSFKFHAGRAGFIRMYTAVRQLCLGQPNVTLDGFTGTLYKII